MYPQVLVLDVHQTARAAYRPVRAVLFLQSCFVYWVVATCTQPFCYLYPVCERLLCCELYVSACIIAQSFLGLPKPCARPFSSQLSAVSVEAFGGVMGQSVCMYVFAMYRCMQCWCIGVNRRAGLLEYMAL